jgi:hypothetical protein
MESGQDWVIPKGAIVDENPSRNTEPAGNPDTRHPTKLLTESLIFFKLNVTLTLTRKVASSRTIPKSPHELLQIETIKNKNALYPFVGNYDFLPVYNQRSCCDHCVSLLLLRRGQK